MPDPLQTRAGAWRRECSSAWDQFAAALPAESAQQSNSETAETVLVVPLTSDTDGKQRLPMPVIAPDPGNGLLQRSAAMCGRVSCIRKARLNQRIGAVHPQELRRVRLGVAAVIGLTDLLTAASIERASRP